MERVKIYRPFCSIECNREFHETVVTGVSEPNLDPVCLNCGAGVREYPPGTSIHAWWRNQIAKETR